MNKYLLGIAICSIMSIPFAEKVAVFPVQGVNTDKSFSDAFGLLLANKYETISKATIINPLVSVKAIGPDSNITEAVNKLGVDEYIEINAIGLYLSRKELKESLNTTGTNVIVNVKEADNDDDDDKNISGKDQDLLDNSKTVVTTYRKSKDGTVIYKSEMTLLTYGDIEESSERFALSMYKKLPVDQVQTQANVTRREGMGNNQTFVGKVKGIRLGMAYPVAYTSAKLSSFLTIMYDYRLEGKNFFLEMAIGGRIPSELFEESKRKVGGFNLEIGGDYYLTNNVAGFYIGGGVNPYIDILNKAQLGVAPFIKMGIMLPQNSRMRFYMDLKVAQNVLPIYTGEEKTETTSPYSSYSYVSKVPPVSKDFPTEIGMDFGIAW